MYGFELKAVNDIASISQAIAQAINYRSRSNYTYIIIPMLDSQQFHDEARLGDLLMMCRDNGIGALSVSIDSDQSSVTDLVEVQSAAYRPLENIEWLKRLMKKAEKDRLWMERNRWRR